MKKLSPKIKTTISDSLEYEWIPSSLDNLLIELDHIIEKASENDALILYRGQANNDWLLDSTFVRNAIRSLFKINNYFSLPISIRHRVSFHRVVTSLFLMKFDKILRPSKEAIRAELAHGIDPYFELLKNIQQYPEKYTEVPFIQGTNLIDWTNNIEVALFFSVYEGQRGNIKMPTCHGSLWIYDASSTGKILQTDKTQRILKLMESSEFLNGGRSLPLMLHPQKQTNQERAKNQKPIYIAQMDFRYDLADVWATYDNTNNGNKSFIKVHILEDIKKELSKYLEQKGITENYVFPD